MPCPLAPPAPFTPFGDPLGRLNLAGLACLSSDVLSSGDVLTNLGEGFGLAPSLVRGLVHSLEIWLMPPQMKHFPGQSL
eukprot:5903524-Prorocentrum_lima.AAC.1